MLTKYSTEWASMNGFNKNSKIVCRDYLGLNLKTGFLNVLLLWSLNTDSKKRKMKQVGFLLFKVCECLLKNIGVELDSFGNRRR